MPNAIRPEPTAGARVLHLHVGMPKTGTSAIQAFLARNRDAFGDAGGIHYAESASDRRAARGEPTTGNGGEIARRLRSRKPEDLPAALALLDQVLAAPHQALMLSSEGFWAVPDERMAAFAGALAERGVQARLLAYVRPQVELVQSAYLQKLGSRGFGGTVAEFFDADPSRFFPGARLQALRAIFGPDHVEVRKYPSSRLAGGDVVDDFIEAYGVSWRDGFVRPRHANPSLDPEHYLYARLTAESPWLAGAGNDSLGALRGHPALAGAYAGASGIEGLRVMDAATARHVAEACAADNRLLDELAPEAQLHLDADNRKALEALDAPTQIGAVSRLELLLLHRLTIVEARLAELTARLDGTTPPAPGAANPTARGRGQTR